MNNASFSELNITTIKEKLRRKKYDIKHVVNNNDQIERLYLKDMRTERLYVGKLSTRSNEGESYYWPCLHHRNLERLLDIVKVNSKATIYITLCNQDSTLRNLVHQETFFKSPLCYLRKKNYIKDVLWGLEYLHANSLCLMNLCDSNVLIYETPNRAVISDFSALTMVEKAKKQAFTVTPFHRAPELSIKSFKKFDPKAAEMWTAGVMILEIILKHEVPWKSVDLDPNRVIEIVDGLELQDLEAANPKSPLTTRDLDELKRLTSWLFCRDPSNRCSALSAAVSEFIQSSRNVMASRKALPLDRELSTRSTKKNENPNSSDENGENLKNSGSANEERCSETESQLASDEQLFHTCGKHGDINGNYENLMKTKSDCVLLPKTFPVVDGPNCSFSLPGFKNFEGGNLQDAQPNPNSSSSQEDSREGKHSGSDASVSENYSQDEVNEGSSSAPCLNSIDPSELVQIPMLNWSFESFTGGKNKTFNDLNKGDMESKTPFNSRGNSREENSKSPINRNLYIRRSKSCSLLPCSNPASDWIDLSRRTPSNSFRSHSYYVCSSSANLSSYFSENSTDLISLILSIKRRLEFIDSLLFGQRNFPGVYGMHSAIRQKSKESKKEARTNSLKGFDNNAFEGRFSILKNFTDAEHHKKPVTSMEDLQSCSEYQKLIKNQNFTTKTPDQRETTEVKTVTRQKVCKKNNKVREQIRRETFVESTKTVGDAVESIPQSKGSTLSGLGDLRLSLSKVTSMSKIQEALLCKRQYSYQKAVWGKGQINPDLTPPQDHQIQPEKPTKKYRIGKGFIEVEVGRNPKKNHKLTKKGKCKKSKNVAPGDPAEVPDVSALSQLHGLQKKKKKHGCFCLKWKA